MQFVEQVDRHREDDGAGALAGSPQGVDATADVEGFLVTFTLVPKP